jgi:glucose/arabinose dehydrogenase
VRDPTEEPSVTAPAVGLPRIAPPPPRRKLDWRRARTALSTLIAEPERVEQVFDVPRADGNRGILLIVLASAAQGPWTLTWQRYLRHAWRRGRRAGVLAAATWEALLALPLAGVRRRLGVSARDVSHPGGILVAEMRPPGRRGRRHGGGHRDGRLLTLLVTVACALPAGNASALDVGGDPRVDPADFTITTFATGLAYPTSLQELSDGSLLVLVNSPASGLFDSTGELVRLVDADADGVADGPPAALYSGLPGVATSVRVRGQLVFVSSGEVGEEAISVLRLGPTPASPLTWLGAIDFSYPSPAPASSHRNVALAVRDTPGSPGKVDLVWNVGSEQNAEATAATVAGGGLLTGMPGAAAMAMDALWMVTFEDTGGAPVLDNLVQLATGLRNAAGIAFHPDTGVLWFTENGIDPDPPVVQSADELNRLSPAELGGAIEDFGFPDDFVTYRSGVVVGGSAVQPLVVFQPLGDPNTGAESEGAVEIAFAPPGFPASLRAGAFVGFHGRFSLAGVANEENPVAFVDLVALDHFHFIANTEPTVGHPNGLLATTDALFVADLASGGSVFTNTPTGVIHRIRGPGLPRVPALPFAWPGAGALLVGALAARRLRKPRARCAYTAPSARARMQRSSS